MDRRRRTSPRIGTRMAAALALFAELAIAVTGLAVIASPAAAQFFDDRFPFQNRRQPQQRGMFDWFGSPSPFEEQKPAPPPVDFSRAPAPKKLDPKAEAAIDTPIMVLGDAMADWLAYGLEQAYAESPEIGVLRRHRTNSGLIRTEVRNDPRGEYPDWPQAARDTIASQKPKFVLMMIGVNDRRSIRETAQAVRPGKPAPPVAEDPAAAELDKPEPGKTVEAEPPQPGPTANRTLEFRSDAWSEAYIKRIDDTIAALKTSGVPVFWVGLPPLRGPKAAADIPFLNDLYRSRADKAGIIYIDVWDGFVDEEGRFVVAGPDVEGQTRRLRSGDGVYFTQFGARKLAHYVEREIQRWLSARTAPVAAAIPEEPKVEPSAAAVRSGGSHARPLAGPTIPLVAERSSESEELMGSNARHPAVDAMVNKVLMKGEAVSAPAGRADDFAWPRRGVAPVGGDPTVATTDLPMTPMQAEKPTAPGTAVASAAPAADPATGQARPVRRLATRPNGDFYEGPFGYRPDYRPDYRPNQRPQPYQSNSFGFGLFGGGRW
jgi:uncharacterized protein